MTEFWSTFWKDEVFPKLDLGAVLVALNPKLKGSYYLINCPSCNDRKAYAYKDTGRIKCNHENKCSYSADILEYVNGRRVQGDDMARVVRQLAEQCGIHIPEMTKELREQVTATKHKDELFNTLFEECAEKIRFHDMARDYMRGRGFNLEDCAKLEIGYLGDLSKTRLSKDDLYILGLASRNDSGSLVVRVDWENRVVGAIRDARGRMVGLWGRALGGQQAKYLNTTASGLLDEIGAYGIHSISDSAVVCEGPLDKCAYQLAGIPAIALLGSLNKLTPERWKRLYELGLRYATISDDCDPVVSKRVQRQIAAHDAALSLGHESPAIYFISESLFGSEGDASSCFASHGAAGLTTAWEQRMRGVERRAELLSIGIDFGKVESVDRYRSACSQFAKSLQSLSDVELFANHVARISGLSRADLEADYKNLQRKTAERAAASAIVDAANQSDWRGVTAAIRSIPKNKRPVRLAIDEIDEVDAYLKTFYGKEIIGISQPTLPGFNKAISGWRGVSLIASRTGVGKTNFVIQAVLDTMIHNENVGCVFGSFEMQYVEIQSRMFANLVGTEWQDMAFRATNLPLAKHMYRKVANRMIVLDKSNMEAITQDEILAACEYVKKMSGVEKVLVIIDYIDIYEIPPEVKRDNRSENEQQKWQMQEAIDIKDKLGVNGAVIAITETRKGDGLAAVTTEDVMGSSRKAYAVDALCIYNPLNVIDYYEKFELHASGIARRAAPIEIDWAKKTTNKRQIMREGDEIRRVINNYNIDLGVMEVVKTRSAGRKARVELTNYFRQSRFFEGHTTDPAPPINFIDKFDHVEEVDF